MCKKNRVNDSIEMIQAFIEQKPCLEISYNPILGNNPWLLDYSGTMCNLHKNVHYPKFEGDLNIDNIINGQYLYEIESDESVGEYDQFGY